MMKVLLFGFSLCLSIVAFGQLEQKLDSLFLASQKDGFNGNVLYSRGDSIVFSGNYGSAYMDRYVRLNDSSLFDLASNSKQFTAFAIIQLVEAKRLSYETLVREVLPEFPYDSVTVEHLLQHRSGIPYEIKLLKKYRKTVTHAFMDNQDYLDALALYQPKLKFVPGTEHQYSNAGFMILALIIEKISGLDYAEYVRKNLFVPAGMSLTKVVRPKFQPEVSRNTNGYKKKRFSKNYYDPSVDKKSKYYWADGIYGDGVIHSTILDMEKWKQALRYNTLISQESKERFEKILAKTEKLGYGFWVQSTGHGIRYYHPGSWGGYQSACMYYPETNEYYVVLSNNNYDVVSTLGKMMRIVNGEDK